MGAEGWRENCAAWELCDMKLRWRVKNAERASFWKNYTFRDSASDCIACFRDFARGDDVEIRLLDKLCAYELK